MVLTRFLSVLSIDILVKASGIILLPLFLRLMTQDEFGLYNYIISIIQTFSLVLNLGLYIPQSKLYHTYESSEERGRLLFTINSTLFIINAVLVGVFLVFGLDDRFVKFLFDYNSHYGQYKSLIMLSLVISVFVFMLTNFFYSSEKIKQVRIYNICRILLVNVSALSILYFISVDAVQVRLGITYGMELLLLCVFARHFLKEVYFRFDKAILRKSLYMGLPIMISAVFGIIVNFSDKFFLQKYGTLKDLSNYYLAFSFASIVPLVFASFQNVWLPLFLKEKDLAKNFHKTRKLASSMIIFFLLLSFFSWLLFYALFWLTVIPAKYADVIWILPFLLITQIIASITPLLSNYLVYFEKTSLVSLTGFFVSIISIGLGLWLIPLMGVLGALFTTLIANATYLIIYYYLVLLLKKKHSVTKPLSQ